MSADQDDKAGQLDRIEGKLDAINHQINEILNKFQDHDKKIQKLQVAYDRLRAYERLEDDNGKRLDRLEKWRFGIPVNAFFSIAALVLVCIVYFS